MNIKQAKDEIKHTVQAYLKKDEFNSYVLPITSQRPILLIGPPGIGKTQIMEQIAKECGIGLVSYTITHHTRQSAVGLPFISKQEFEGKEYAVTEYTMSEIIASVYQKMKDTNKSEGILFIDEINCVSETLAPTMLQFLQGKTFGNQAIPQGWIIVGAGNPSEYNKSVREFDMVTLDRIRYLNVEQDYGVWKEYAINHGIHPCILSYLDLKPNRFYQVVNDIDGLQFVTARGWSDLSDLMKMYESLNIEITQDIIYEYIHFEDIAEDMMAYYLLYKKYHDDYGIEDILNGKITSSHYARVFNASFDERLAVVNLLLDGITKRVNTYFDLRNQVDSWYEMLRIYHSNPTKEYYEQLLHDELMNNKMNYEQDLISKNEFNKKNQSIQNRKVIFDGENCFECVKTQFNELKEKMEQIEQETISSMESCFEFMGGAFESGQEMVIFVTSLSMNSNCALFLSENEIEAYDQYKKELLIGTRRRELLDILSD